MSKDTAETWRPEQRTRSDLCCTRLPLIARWRGVKGRGERPAARERPGRNKVGEDRGGPKQGCGGEKGADGRHPGVLMDKLWGLMGRAGEGGIKDEAQSSLWEPGVGRGHS